MIFLYFSHLSIAPSIDPSHFLDPPGTIRKQRATIEKLTRENRKMKAGGSIRGLLFDPCLSIGRNISELSTVDINFFRTGLRVYKSTCNPCVIKCGKGKSRHEMKFIVGKCWENHRTEWEILVPFFLSNLSILGIVVDLFSCQAPNRET